MLSGGTVFVDHASDFVKKYNQVSLGAADTVWSKERYEHQGTKVGVHIKEYHRNTGVYKYALLSDAVDKRHKKMTFYGVGAHGQNDVTECAIQTIIRSTRTMMRHQDLHWPAHFDMRLWPFALEHVVYLWNPLPNGAFQVDGGLALVEI